MFPQRCNSIIIVHVKFGSCNKQKKFRIIQSYPLPSYIPIDSSLLTDYISAKISFRSPQLRSRHRAPQTLTKNFSKTCGLLTTIIQTPKLFQHKFVINEPYSGLFVVLRGPECVGRCALLLLRLRHGLSPCLRRIKFFNCYLCFSLKEQ